MMWNHSAVDWAWMAVLMVGFWVAILVIATVATHALGVSLQPPATGPSPMMSPREILAKRYALGEIDADEYHTRLETLH